MPRKLFYAIVIVLVGLFLAFAVTTLAQAALWSYGVIQ